MNVFDRICALFAFAIGILAIVFGILGIFIGTRAWINLPPILGVLPAFVGWGIVRSVYFGWYSQGRDRTPATQPSAMNTPTPNPGGDKSSSISQS
jgi:xanthosine utilization system XapX-like protein